MKQMWPAALMVQVVQQATQHAGKTKKDQQKKKQEPARWQVRLHLGMGKFWTRPLSLFPVSRLSHLAQRMWHLGQKK